MYSCWTLSPDYCSGYSIYLPPNSSSFLLCSLFTLYFRQRRAILLSYSENLWRISISLSSFTFNFVDSASSTVRTFIFPSAFLSPLSYFSLSGVSGSTRICLPRVCALFDLTSKLISWAQLSSWSSCAQKQSMAPPLILRSNLNYHSKPHMRTKPYSFQFPST